MNHDNSGVEKTFMT